MTGLADSIAALKRALGTPRHHQLSRWLVRHRLFAVAEALTGEATRSGEAWLVARQSAIARERDALLAEVERQRRRLDDADTEHAWQDLRRLVVDLEHHRQRINDLVYDGVSLEIGGSE